MDLLSDLIKGVTLFLKLHEHGSKKSNDLSDKPNSIGSKPTIGFEKRYHLVPPLRV
jgi:hypothetical protein